MKRTQPKTRNWQAVAAHSRTSAGAMGGSARQNNKRDRKATRQALKRGTY